MEKEKTPKIEYETDIVQGTIRVRYKFDFEHPQEQMNFPLGTEERVIEEALKDRYNQLKRSIEKPIQTGKREIDWE